MDIKDIEDIIDNNDHSEHYVLIEDETEIAESSKDLFENEIFGFKDNFKEVKDHNPYYRQVTKCDDVITDVPIKFKNATDDEIELLKKTTKYIIELLKKAKTSKVSLGNATRNAAKKYKIMYSKTDLVYGYKLLQMEGLDYDPDISAHFLAKPFRSESGVMVFAVFTHPMWRESGTGKMKAFSCKHNCSYCPEQPGRPRSYVDGEPGNDRAVSVDYDIIQQVRIRAASYDFMGHNTNEAKAEVIILGGTFHSYDDKYHVEFFRNLYYAFNTLHSQHEYKNRKMLTLEEEMKINSCLDIEFNKKYNNENTCRVIGLTIETRPDQITNMTIPRLRDFGVTRVQLGIQHTNDRMLTRVNRGCTSLDSMQAILNLKRFGFKVDIHLMPDLPKPYTEKFYEENKNRLNSSSLIVEKKDIDWDFDVIEADKIMFEKVFHGNMYCPDQVKIYPFQVMDWTKLKEEHERGLHVSYGTINKDDNPAENEMIKMLIDVKERIPPYVRINRLKRDIPDSYSFGGLTDMHGRNFIHKLMESQNKRCKCIRCNEIKKQTLNIDDTLLKIHKYNASFGEEYFIYFTDKQTQTKIIGFIRVRFDDKAGQFLKFDRHSDNDDIKIKSETVISPELQNCAMIRELHVYGEAARVHTSTSTSTSSSVGVGGGGNKTNQHLGFGTRLVYTAFTLMVRKGYAKVSVIPGEGVKQYYNRKFGFVNDGKYMTLHLPSSVDDLEKVFPNFDLKQNNIFDLDHLDYLINNNDDCDYYDNCEIDNLCILI